MAKVAFVCNSAEPTNLYPVFVLASAAAASGDEVIIFFTPQAATALKKGVLEGIKAKGMTDMKELVEGVQDLGGKLLLCELSFEAKDLKKEEIRDGVEITGATSFMAKIRDANVTFSF
ncbi:MAG: peroxiredoxin [Candidatus Cloacimonas sp. 4484_209]|nr:MAG: peroxiredoxin [Candidatus Cloacimonas sp. 4484_209]